ncbi:type VI secretion system membrane subunit TssM [Vibrio navarrensis]|nr:type VI secretion system membrane subunit TssM [Vibrio navarrensis]
MKAINTLIRQRWVIGLIGLFAASVFIWFVGPLIAIAGVEPLKSGFNRLLVIVVLVFAWGVTNVIRQQRERKEQDESIQNLLEVDSFNDKEAASEIDVMRERIERAVQVITKDGKGKKNLYSLPWYVLIGPPGTGKTSVLKHSGLEFPLSDALGSDAIAGIGGTRHCDWWFTNKAVLIDTAGRYTTQDSQAHVDSKAWYGFLGLLKKYRKQRPINGALVTVSLASMMTQTRTERGLHARAIKNRLQELKNQLGMQFPIYVVLTKADLIAGFNEFFADLSRDERDELLGFVFPREVADERGVISLFNKEFHDLLERLDKRMMQRLESEEDLDKRALMFEFPKQLRCLQANLDEFLSEIFAQNKFEEPAMIRGVFIVSALQEGMPVDRIMAETSQGLGLGRPPLRLSSKESCTYFVKNLFEEVIFKEQLLGTLNRHHQKQSGWLRTGTYAACAGVSALALALWMTSYQWNSRLIEQTDAQLDEVQNLLKNQDFDFTNELIPSLNVLNKIIELPMGYAGQHVEDGQITTLGLYQGEKIGQSAKAAYHKALVSYFSTFIETALLNELQENEQHREYLYETLKTYLMLFNDEKLDTEHVLNWFTYYYERTYPGALNEELRTDLALHTQNFVKQTERGLYLNNDAVSAARHVLTQMSLSERAYQRMKLQFVKSHVASFRLTDVLGTRGIEQFERKSGKPLSMGISGFYTYNGFHSIFQLQIGRTVKALMEENWVYGDEIDARSIDQDLAIAGVRERYYRDYVYEWKSLLEDIQLKPTSSLKTSLDQSVALVSSERPLESLLRAVQKEVALTKVSLSQNEQAAAEVAGNVAKVKFSGTADRLEMYRPSEENAFNVSLPGKEVEAEFAEIIQMTDQDFDEIHQALNSLKKYLTDLSSSGNNQKVAYKSLLNGTLASEVAASINHARQLLPSPFDAWLNELSSESAKLAEKGSRVHLNTLWTNKVLKPYERSIQGRYPFSPTAKKEVTLKDFSRFFGYGGTLDAFFNEYLAPFVDTSKSVWRFEKEIGVSQETLAVFQRAEKIRQAFFEPDNTLRVDFGMKPVYLDQHITSFVLELGGQNLVYKHGPARSKTLSWPARQSATRVVFTPPDSRREIAHTFEGDWGLFKLLDQSLKARPESRKDNIVMIDLKGNKVQLELIPKSTMNPFWSNDMERFRCPQTL